jgi:hypothetical protein
MIEHEEENRIEEFIALLEAKGYVICKKVILDK